jgi:hypothetical protein
MQRLIAILSLILVFGHASRAAIGAAVPHAKWTIMVFLNAKNNLESEGIANYEQMVRVGSTDKVNVIVEFGRPKKNNSNVPRDSQWSGVLRLRVERGQTIKSLPDVAKMRLGDVDMASGTELASFVVWAEKHYVADHYMLVMWDHGRGWQLQLASRSKTKSYRPSSFTPASTALKDNSIYDNNNGTPPIPTLNGFRSISYDADKKKIMYNRDMADSLARSLTKPVDVLGFDACLMSMVETSYAVRNVARVMVGSEENEPAPGWDYTDWLEKLTANPDIDGLALGKLLIGSYKKTYEGNTSYYTSLSLVEESRVKAVVDAIDGLADALVVKVSSENEHVKEARAACDTYGQNPGLHGIDLYRFVTQISSKTSNEVIKTRAKTVLDSIVSSVPSYYVSPNTPETFGSRGLAIYFPASEREYLDDPDRDGYDKTNAKAQFPVEFVYDARWVDFLRAYWSALKPPTVTRVPIARLRELEADGGKGLSNYSRLLKEGSHATAQQQP